MKKIISWLIIGCIVFSINIQGAEDNTYLSIAEKLKSLGVFMGNDNGFELDRVANRTEAIVMLVRLMGASDDVKNNSKSAKFNDLLPWSVDYIQYAFEKQWTKGLNESTFGAEQTVQSKDMIVLLLRSLGYKEEYKDFNYDTSLNKALEIGLIDQDLLEQLKSAPPTRGIIAQLLYNTLIQNTRKSVSLAEKLIDSGDINKETAIETGIYMEPATIEAINNIQQQYNQLKTKRIENSGIYKTNPVVTDTYDVGELNSQSIEWATETIRFIRNIVGLTNNLDNDKVWNMEAQYAAHIMAVNKQLDHAPARPANYSDNGYVLASMGAATSNIYMGYHSIEDVVYQFIEDSDAVNLSTLGHRRWLLNPSLSKFGLGYIAQQSFPNVTAAIKIRKYEENSTPRIPTGKKFIAWPAPTAFPVDLIHSKTPWSITLDHKLFDASKISKMKVELTQLGTDNKWIFEATDKGKNTEMGYFNVDTQGFGVPFCIIFQPANIQYQAKDLFKVVISNIYTFEGIKTEITYTTTLFSLK